MRLQVLLDLGWLRRPELQPLIEAVAAAAGLAPGQVLVTCNHSHAVAHPTLDRVTEPGGELIPRYLETLREKLVEAVQAALAGLRPAVISYGRGRCDLAVNRDFWDEANGQFVCGYNPGALADDTVMVARVTAAEDGRPLAALVNYACHPTTLAWGNALISPDYPGACREVVEQATRAPCAFLLGVCGELAPREGYVGDTAVADRNGRQLGYAALSALAALGPPATDFVYSGPVVSGATVGAWEHRPLSEERRRQAATFAGGSWELPLPLLPLPTREEILARREEYRRQEAAALAARATDSARDAHALVERDTRLLGRLANLTAGDHYPLHASAWRVGDAVWVTVEAELYSAFQTTLRQRFPGTPLLVTPLTNGCDTTYLPPRELYGKGIYQEQIALLAPGCLEAVTEETARRIAGLIGEN